MKQKTLCDFSFIDNNKGVDTKGDKNNDEVFKMQSMWKDRCFS